MSQEIHNLRVDCTSIALLLELEGHFGGLSNVA